MNMQAKSTLQWFLVTIVITVLTLVGMLTIFSELGLHDRLRFISRGIYGKDALDGPFSMVTQGFLFHFIITSIWTGSFFMLYPGFNFQQPNWIKTGVVFGLLVWGIMNFAVVPIAITKDFPKALDFLGKSLAMHILFFGLPLALIYIKYLYPKKLKIS